MGIDGHQRPLRLLNAVYFLIVKGQIPHGCFRRPLHIHINGGVNLETFFINRIRAVAFDERLGNVINEIRSDGDSTQRLWLYQFQLGLLQLSGRTFINVMVLAHLLQHDGLSRLCRR